MPGTINIYYIWHGPWNTTTDTTQTLLANFAKHVAGPSPATPVRDSNDRNPRYVLIPSSRAALPPRIAAFSSSERVVVAKT